MIDIRLAKLEDIEQLNKIARQFNRELAYIPKAKYIQHINNNECHVATIENTIVGFVNWHRRKDNRSTIYELAVDKKHHKLGVGKRLIYSVPCPIRLKVTQSNENARCFYEHLGFNTLWWEDGRKQRLCVKQLSILPILVAGNNPEMPRIAKASQMAYGVRHDCKAYEQPVMLDINWKNYIWEDYINKIKEYKPLIAMVPDYEHPDKQQDMLNKVNILRSLGIIRIMVCPKFEGAIAHIPKDCTIALSVPTDYAAWLPSEIEEKQLKGKMLHLLGGSPKQWLGGKRKWLGDRGTPLVGLLERYTNIGATVISVDGNSHETASGFGSYWENGKWNRPTDGSWLFEGENKNVRTMMYSGKNISKELQDKMFDLYTRIK